MNIEFIGGAAIIFALSAVALIICRKIQLPEIIALLFVGIVSGPFGLGLISASNQMHIEHLAEFGIILLLFTLGIEFSFKRLIHIKKLVLFTGFSQVILTILSAYGVFLLLGHKSTESLFIAMLIALSSTAIVLKFLQESNQLDAPHGKASLGILIFQDLSVIFMILLTPLMVGEVSVNNLIIPLIKSLFVIGITLVVAIKIIPKLLERIIVFRSNQLFLISTIGVCLAIAYITSAAGLSLGIGAFLAGLAISESQYNHRALELTVPFRDVFLSFFFISIGMLLDLGFVWQNLGIITLFLIGIVTLKFIIIAIATYAFGLPLRHCLMTAILVSQVGEFSFVLAQEGLKFHILSPGDHQIFLAITLLSMALTPLFAQHAPELVNFLTSNPILQRLDKLSRNNLPKDNFQGNIDLKDHLIIIGYGLNGKWLALLAKILGIPYLIIESNPETVEEESKKGEKIVFGDASNLALWQRLDISQAKVAAIGISDPIALPQIVKRLKEINPNIHIVARTTFLTENKIYQELGVNDIICKEFESTLETVRRIMNKYNVTDSVQTKITDLIKKDITPQI